MKRKSRKRGRVLLIEDDDLNMELVQIVLEGAGYEVLCASTAATGIDIARRERPDAILMDVQMAEMDGLEAAQCLRADPATATIPIVAVTAHVKKEDQRRCLEAGCALHLSKPVDTRALPEIVERIIHAAEHVA
ncbi:MAG TPA: response regulator [Candidatus Krumholzibacteria bacterium]|jgi:CheY-like chemotaxis protein|nr:response regulator [Candidatus Krumholzibacteria bacterium]